MARVKCRTDRLEVRSQKTRVVSFIIRRVRLRTERVGSGYRDTLLNEELRDETGRRFEEIAPGRFRCVQTGEEYDS